MLPIQSEIYITNVIFSALLQITIALPSSWFFFIYSLYKIEQYWEV